MVLTCPITGFNAFCRFLYVLSPQKLPHFHWCFIWFRNLWWSYCAFLSVVYMYAAVPLVAPIAPFVGPSAIVLFVAHLPLPPKLGSRLVRRQFAHFMEVAFFTTNNPLWNECARLNEVKLICLPTLQDNSLRRLLCGHSALICTNGDHQIIIIGLLQINATHSLV